MASMLTHWDPFRELSTLQREMNRLFQDYGNRGEQDLTTTSFVPPVDIYEDEHSIMVKMEVPGIDQKDLDIRVENHTLTVRGERKFEKDEKEENFHRIERRYGSFMRSFALPQAVDTENINADYDNGVLKIRMSKREEAKPKQIKVNVGQGQKTLEGKGKAA